MNELVSIIIPTYNSENYIIDTLESIDKQNYKNWECIIVNDGSTDNTENVVFSYIENKPGKFIYHFQENTGLSGARNKGLALSKGEYVQFIDSDDILFEDKIEIMMNYYNNNPNPNRIYFCDYIFSNDNNAFEENKTQFKLYNSIESITPIRLLKMYNDWDYKFVIPPHCFLYPKRFIENQKFDTNLKSKEDWDFYLSILNNLNIEFHGIPTVACSYRVRKNSMSQDYTNLIKYTFIVLNKWKNKNSFNYFNRVSFYLLQSYIHKLSNKNSIDLRVIFDQIKNLHTPNYTAITLLLHILLPIQFVKKCFNVLRIRMK